MRIWHDNLKYNPLTPLLECKNEAILFFVQRDLLNNTVMPESLWQLCEPQKILKKQQNNGSWIYPGGKEDIRSKENYNQIETYRQIGFLIEKFGFTVKHPAIKKAAEYLFSFQSKEGDFRGIYGNQYSPNYTAGITELLIKAGYAFDTRIEKVFEWLLSIRQNNGGWAIPLRTQNKKLDVISMYQETIKPDKSKPFSYMVTGVVLRAFAGHPEHNKSKEANRAGELLLSRFFKKDNYPDRSGAEYWLRFTFPFWFTDLISALDSLSLLGFSKQKPQIGKALQWFIDNQQKNGLWELKILKGSNREITTLWLSLAICRVLKRFYSQ